MRRITMSLDETLADQFDEWAHRHGYQQRSEAFRDLLRERLERERIDSASGHCVGSITYVYNHHERRLAERLTGHQHAHHDVCLSTVHYHLDHDNCMEVQLLKGPLAAVRSFANSVVAERGVRHGNVHLVPVQSDDATDHKHGHAHLTPNV